MKRYSVLVLLCTIGLSYAQVPETAEQKAACDSMVDMVKCLNKMLSMDMRQAFTKTAFELFFDRNIRDLQFSGLLENVSDGIKDRSFEASEDQYKELQKKTEKAQQGVDNVQNACIKRMLLALIEEN